MTASSPHIALENVLCPDCGRDEYHPFASGPDYDNHCCGDQEFQLVRCKHCETVYLNPRPTVEMLPRIYTLDEYYSYSFADEANSLVLRARQRRDLQKIEQVMSALGKNPAEVKVLDIGAGDGSLLLSFHAADVPKDHLYGVELEQMAVDNLERKGFHGLLGRAEDLDLPDASFDVVAMIQVIEHVADPKEVMRNLHRILRPGGIFLIETPNVEGWDRGFFARKTWGVYHFPRHWTLWSLRTINRILKDTGFEVVNFSTPAAAVVWTWSINHVMQRWRMPRPLVNFFSMNNPFVLAFFLLLDLLPSMMKRSAGMRIIARRKP